MQCNYDFLLHYCLFGASQMLGEFKSFVTGMSTIYLGMGSSTLIWTPCSSFNMGNKLSNSRKRVFGCSQKLSWRKQEILVSLPALWESLETYVKQSQCYWVFVIYHDLICEPFDS